MSTSGSRAGGSDALSSLLSDLGGVEGNIFSRPKTLDGMKRTQDTPSRGMGPSKSISKPQSANPSSAFSSAHTSYPSQPTPSNGGLSSGLHSIGDLEDMLRHSGSSTAAPPSQASASQASLAGMDDPLDWSFTATTTTAPTATAAAVPPPFDDPFSDFMAPSPAPPTATSSIPLHDEDPLHMFGGTPAPAPAPSTSIPSHTPPAHAPTSNVFDHQDDFLPGFSQPPASTPAPVPRTLAGDIIEEVSLKEESDRRYTPLSSSLATAPAAVPSSGASVQQQQPSRTLSSSSSSSFAQRISEPAAPPTTSHKAFAFLDAKAAAAAAAAGAATQAQHAHHAGSAQAPQPHQNPRRDSGPLDRTTSHSSTGTAPGTAPGGPLGGGLSPAGGSSSLDDPQYTTFIEHPPHHHHGGVPATETVVELGHRAAKVLTAGTKWFMRASKQIANEVHSKIEKHRQHGGGHQGGHFGDSSAADDGTNINTNNSAVQSFYYDWASQLVRLSPGTRAAALGAMQEEDRMEVQRIMDEAELGETVLNATTAPNEGRFQKESDYDEYERYGSRNSQPAASQSTKISPKQQQQAPPPPQPPSYEEIMQSAEPSASASSAPRKEASKPTQRPKATPAAAAPAPAADLLGIDGDTHHHIGVTSTTSATTPGAASTGSQQTRATSAQPKPVAAVEEVDFLGMDTQSNTAPSNTYSSTTSAPGRAPSASTTTHIDDLFTVPKPGAPTARPPPSGARSTGALNTAAASGARPSSHRASASAGGLDSMIDLGEALSSVDTTGYDALYADAEEAAPGGEAEPEIRRILRQKRIAEKHERMQRMLAEKRAREEQEDAEKAGKVVFRDTLKPKIDAWAAGKKDNIRALLSTLHTVLWEDSGWTSPSIADMVDPGKVKRWYMKANLVVHPDKVKQKGGTLEQVATADMIFDVLKLAWGKFEASR